MPSVQDWIREFNEAPFVSTVDKIKAAGQLDEFFRSLRWDQLSEHASWNVLECLEMYGYQRRSSEMAYEVLAHKRTFQSFSGGGRDSFQHHLERSLATGDNEMAKQLVDLMFSILQNPSEDIPAFSPSPSKSATLLRGWFLVLGMPGRAADCVALQSDSLSGWAQIEGSACWNQAIYLYQLAGDVARARELAEKAGRRAKAQRLAGQRDYAPEEINFPRGANRRVAMADVLEDMAMKVDVLCELGQTDAAREVIRKICEYEYFRECAQWDNLQRVLEKHNLTTELNKVLEVKAQTRSKELDEWLGRAKRRDWRRLDVGFIDELYPRDLHAVLNKLVEDGEFDLALEFLEAEPCFNYQKYKSRNDFLARQVLASQARVLYQAGRKLDAARRLDQEWDIGGRQIQGPAIGSSFRPDEITPWAHVVSQYETVLGIAALYEEAGGQNTATSFLRKVERAWLKEGRWQALFGVYYDMGYLGELERVARQIDELECAAIAYEAAEQPLEAARIYSEIAPDKRNAQSTGKNAKDKPKRDSSDKTKGDSPVSSVCPGCGVEIEPDWVVCPVCDFELQELRCQNRDCGRPLKPNWKRCPVCRTEVI